MAIPWQTLIAILEQSHLGDTVVAVDSDTPAVSRGPQVAGTRLLPKFRLLLAADFSSTGYLGGPLEGLSSVDVIAHGYNTAASTPDSLAEEIADHFETMGLVRGRGDAGGGLYGGSFFIQNEATGTYDSGSDNDRVYGLFYNQTDLLTAASWGNAADTIGGSDDDFAPFTANAIASTKAVSLATAAALKTKLDARGLCLPSRKHDDWELRSNTFVVANNALLFDTSQHTNIPGFISSGALAADSRYADTAGNPILASKGPLGPTGNPLVPESWATIISGAPAYSAGLKWSHASNQAFSNYITSRLIEAASYALRFGPEHGYRQYFPLLKTSNYNVLVGSSIDPGMPPFGGTNDYSWVRFSPRETHIWQELSAPVLYGGDRTSRAVSGESNSDFYRRVNIERLISCRSSQRGSTMTPWMAAPGTVVSIDRVNSTNHTVTTDDFFAVAKACVLVGCYELIIFAPGSPFLHWDSLALARKEIIRWARSFFSGSRNGSRTISLSR